MAPPMAMRGMIHSYGRRALAVAFTAAVAGTVIHMRLILNYDPYTRMKEICAEGKGYMHTCPKDLADMYKEKGKEIAPL
ncbi:hypothetical protein OSTOST_25867 [Ostertagia ostertagi]